MKKIMFFVAAAFALVAVGCSKDEVAVNDEVQYITEFKADFAGPDTRIAVTHNPASGLKFSWEIGDKLYIYDPEVNNTYAVYEYDSDGKFKFNNIGTAMLEGKDYFATNRAGISNPFFTKDGEGNISFKMTLSSGVKNLPLISDIFSAKTDGTIAKMHHTVGVVEVPVKLMEGSTFTELDNFGFKSNITAGDFYAAPAYPYFIDDANNNVYNEAWAKESVSLKTDQTTSCFIPVFPRTYSSVIFKYEYNEDVAGSYGAGTNVIVACGKITKLQETVNLKLE